MAADRPALRALVAAVAAVVFALVTSDVWRLTDALGVLNLAVLTVVSLVAIVVFLVVAHGRPARTTERERQRPDQGGAADGPT